MAEENISAQELTKGFFDVAQDVSKAFVGFTGATGIAGFRFDISDDEEITLENAITDHYTEDNVPVQDNIVNRPVKVTLRGLVGEYVYTPPKSESLWDKAVKKAQNLTEKLITVASYLPPVSDFTQQAFNYVKKDNKTVSDTLEIATDAFKLYRNINIPTDRQSRAFLFFEALWRSRQTFTIQTPYRFYTNMAILSLKTVQSGETRDNTDFEITFKQINRVTSNDLSDKSLQGRLKNMAKDYVNKGIASVKDVSMTAVSTVSGWVGQEAQ